ncbi:MAG: hypothetical protein WCY11_15945 [Novosphingobium sp.]
MLRFLTDPADTDLVSLELVKTELDLTGEAQDEALEERIAQVSATVAGECNRVHFGSANVEEIVRVKTGRRTPLWLRHWPVTAVASVSEDGRTLDASEWLLAEKRQLLRRSKEAGRLIGWQGCEITVTYTGGYALPEGSPADLRRAVLVMVQASWAGRGRDPLLRRVSVPGVIDQSFALPGVVGGLSGPWPSEVQSTLTRYRNTNVG